MNGIGKNMLIIMAINKKEKYWEKNKFNGIGNSISIRKE